MIGSTTTSADLKSLNLALDALDHESVPAMSAYIAWGEPGHPEITATELSTAVRRYLSQQPYSVRGFANHGPAGVWAAGINAPGAEDVSYSVFARVDLVCKLGGALAQSVPGVRDSLGQIDARIADTPGSWGGASPWRGWLASMLALACRTDPPRVPGFTSAHGMSPKRLDIDDIDARAKAKAEFADLPDGNGAALSALVNKHRKSRPNPGRMMMLVHIPHFTAASRAAVAILASMLEAESTTTTPSPAEALASPPTPEPAPAPDAAHASSSHDEAATAPVKAIDLHNPLDPWKPAKWFNDNVPHLTPDRLRGLRRQGKLVEQRDWLTSGPKTFVYRLRAVQAVAPDLKIPLPDTHG